ncbi:MAG: hypothetical protein CVV03_12660 [Firmicutes bacterium HGW-Firmicutes-8]|nr:MAG: hypothetical protein CVV03_12660 [Firmicutes bacterium HGW-Firmicutes-8]
MSSIIQHILIALVFGLVGFVYLFWAKTIQRLFYNYYSKMQKSEKLLARVNSPQYIFRFRVFGLFSLSIFVFLMILVAKETSNN